MVSTSAIVFQKKHTGARCCRGECENQFLNSLWTHHTPALSILLYRFGLNHFGRVTPLMNKSCTWYSTIRLSDNKGQSFALHTSFNHMAQRISESQNLIVKIIHIKSQGKKNFVSNEKRKFNFSLSKWTLSGAWHLCVCKCFTRRFMHKRSNPFERSN